MGTKRKSEAHDSGAKSKAAKVDCWLLQLPRELRDEIWISVFSATRLAHGKRDGHVLIKPALHSLALLRVCKQISADTNKRTSGPKNAENKAFWIRHVLFNFEDMMTVLDKLSLLPLSTLSQIRHMRIVDGGLARHPPGRREDEGLDEYGPAAVFMLLPGLCLDRLTLLVPSWNCGQEQCYKSLQDLVQRGNGWKELHYITPSSCMLGYGRDDRHVWADIRRKPQPSGWNELLLQRDGKESRSSVNVFRSIVADAPDITTIMNSSTREAFDQIVTSPTELNSFGLRKDKTLTAAKKSLLVIVKRGDHANISVPDEPSEDFEREDIRRLTDDMSWPVWTRIREKGDWMVMSDPEDREQPTSFETEEPVGHDAYRNPDEYVWGLE